MSAAERHALASSLLCCFAVPDVGEFIEKLDDAELRRAYAQLCSRLAVLRELTEAAA